MLHQFGVSFDLYCDTRKHKIKITQNIKKEHIIPLETLHPQGALHYAVHTQQADREHYSWPYVTRRSGFLKSLPVSAASVPELWRGAF